MAFKAFMKVESSAIGDIAGAAIEANHDGWIEIVEFSHRGDRQVTGARASGVAVYNALVVSYFMDKSYPLLKTAFSRAERVNVTIHVLAQEEAEYYYRVELPAEGGSGDKSGLIRSIDVLGLARGEDARPKVTVEFAYEDINEGVVDKEGAEHESSIQIQAGTAG